MSDKKFIILASLLGAFAFLVFLLMRLPAQLLTSQLQKYLPISIAHSSGTVWNGKVSNLSINTVQLDSLEWRLKFWPLVTGHARLLLNVEGRGFNFKGDIKLAASGNLLLRDAIINTESATLAQLAQFPDMISGQLSATIEELEIADMRNLQAQLPRIQSTLQWKNASILYEGTHVLGDYSAQLQSQENNHTVEKILITYSDHNAYLSLNGKSEWLANGQYSTALRLTPRANLSPTIVNFLPFLGAEQPDTDGTVTLKRAGHINEVIQWLGMSQ